MQLIFGGRRPVDLRVQQPVKALPVSLLDRHEHVGYRWDLLSHAALLPCVVTLGPRKSSVARAT